MDAVDAVVELGAACPAESGKTSGRANVEEGVAIASRGGTGARATVSCLPRI